MNSTDAGIIILISPVSVNAFSSIRDNLDHDEKRTDESEV
jgi:hypothetical protein